MRLSGFRILALITIVISLKGYSNSNMPLSAGNEAPTFSLPTPEGNREALSVWCGDRLSKPYINDRPHTVILSFWATYCKPCKKEIPELIKFQERFRDRDVKTFLISIDKQGAQAVNPYMKENKVTLPVLLDPYRRTAERYNVKALPALFVIAPDGTIKYSSVGYRKEIALDSLLSEVVNAVSEKRDVVEPEITKYPAEEIRISDGSAKRERKTEKSSNDRIPGGSHNRYLIKPRDKWRAVAQVECGYSIQEVADELNVEVDEVRAWYEELKSAALEVWKNSGAAKGN